MALLLSESDVKSILTMPLALEAVEDSFKRLADGSALLHSRAAPARSRQKLPPLHGRRRCHQRLHGLEDLHQLRRRPALPDSAVQRRVRRAGGANRSRLHWPDAHRRRQRRRHQIPRARQRHKPSASSAQACRRALNWKPSPTPEKSKAFAPSAAIRKSAKPSPPK